MRRSSPTCSPACSSGSARWKPPRRSSSRSHPRPHLTAPPDTGGAEPFPFRIRAGAPDDVPAIARAHVAAWRAAYGEILGPDVLAGLSAVDRAARWSQILAEADSSVLVLEPAHAAGAVGFAYLRSAPYADGREERTGELDSFNLDPAVWGRGAGRHLFAAVLGEARRRGFDELILWVFEGNRRARRFYERAGMTFDGTVVSHPRFKVPLLRYRMAVGREGVRAVS